MARRQIAGWILAFMFAVLASPRASGAQRSTSQSPRWCCGSTLPADAAAIALA